MSQTITFDRGIVTISDIIFSNDLCCSFEKLILPGEYTAELIDMPKYQAFRIHRNDNETKAKIAKNKSWRPFISMHMATTKTIGVFQNTKHISPKFIKAIDNIPTGSIRTYEHHKKKASRGVFLRTNKDCFAYGIQTKGRIVAMEFRMYFDENDEPKAGENNV